MLNIFKMDMFRILHSKMFYICMLSMNLVAGSMIFFGTIPSFSVVMGSGASDMDWVQDVLQYTISGLSTTASLTFSGSTFVTIVAGGLIWTATCAVLGSRAAKLKDI